MNRATLSFLTLSLVLLLGSCFFFFPGSKSGDENTLTILCWNVQNLFDGVNNGTEYREFIPGARWNVEDFHRHLIQLTRVIEEAYPGGPDILLLQEVENLNVLEEWNSRYLKNFEYRTVLATPKGDRAITTGILSRFPIIDFRSHGYDQGDYHLGRPIAEVLAAHPRGNLRLFNNHWKSKSGGVEETEPIRRAAAAAVNHRLEELHRAASEVPFVLAGDFNEELEEFLRRGSEVPTGPHAPGGRGGSFADGAPSHPGIRLSSNGNAPDGRRRRVQAFYPLGRYGAGVVLL